MQGRHVPSSFCPEEEAVETVGPRKPSLSDGFETLLHYLVQHHMAAIGGKSEEETVECMELLAKTLLGGREKV